MSDIEYEISYDETMEQICKKYIEKEINIQDLDYYFADPMEYIPEEDRDDVYERITKEIKKYWKTQYHWEASIYRGVQNNLNSAQKKLKKKKKKSIEDLEKSLEIIKRKEPTDLEVLLSEEIEEMKSLDVVINRIERPNKDHIKKLIKEIFDKYNIKGSDDFLKLLLPQI